MLRPSLPAFVLALLLPLVVMVAAWRGLREPPSDHGYASAFAERLAGEPVEVVVLGSSLAHRGVDLSVLARELGLGREQVEMLQLPHASTAHWYAILKNHVYAQGHRPKLVIIAGALTTMLNHDLLRYPANVERLVEQLSDDEPVIAEKVFGFDDASDFRALFLRQAAGRWRASLLEGLRDLVLAAAFTSRPRLDEATRLAERLNEAVFPNEAMDYALHRDVATGVGAGGDLPVLADRPFVLREQALLPDVAALAQSNGSRVVWVRMPFPPSNRDVDDVPAEIERDAVAWMDELGAGYLDLRSLDLSDDDFEDMRHLSKRGAVVFTTALARTLDALGALSPDGGVQVVRGLGDVPPPERVGVPPDLVQPAGVGCTRRARGGPLDGFDEALLPFGVLPPIEVRVGTRVLPPGPAEGCDGTWRLGPEGLVVAAPDADAEVEVQWALGPVVLDGGPVAWVAPGTALVWRMEQPWKLPPRTFGVVARGIRFGPSPTASLRLGELDFPMSGGAGRLAAVARPARPEGAWALAIVVPPEGGPLLVHHLAVGAPPTTTALLGKTETLYGASVRIVGGRVDDTGGRVSYAAPPSLAPIPVTPRAAPRNMGAIALPKLSDLADAEEKDASRASSCSPVRVLEDGVPLPLPHELCYDVLTKGGGRSCHAGSTLYFASPSGGAPVDNGRTYTLGLDPDRSCATLVQQQAATLRGSYWLYPGDVATFSPETDRLKAFRDGASLLLLEVIPHVGTEVSPLEVELLVGDRVVVSRSWTPSGVRRASVLRLPIDPPLPPWPGEVRLRVRNPSDTAFQLVTMVALEETPSQGGAAPVADPPTAPPSRTRAPDAVERVGVLPVVPMSAAVQPFEDDAFQASAFPIYCISNPSLEKAGLGPWSPLRVRADGVDLLPVGTRKAFRAGCTACFLHAGQAIVFRPPGAHPGELALRLDDAFPVDAGGGERVWWLYPGQTARLHFDAPWRGPRLSVEARVTAFHPQRELAGEKLVLRAAGQEAAFRPGTGPGVGIGQIVVDRAGRGGFDVEVHNGSDRGFVILRSVDLTDGEGAVRVLRGAGADG